MPLYEFYCISCGNSFEDILQWNENAPSCPICHSEKTEKIISSPSPLKKGAFPFKPGPVHPMATNMLSGKSGCPGCSGNKD